MPQLSGAFALLRLPREGPKLGAGLGLLLLILRQTVDKVVAFSFPDHSAFMKFHKRLCMQIMQEHLGT